MKGAIMLSGGGSGKLFAAIGVTYPAGSTLTCASKQTGKVLTAKPESDSDTQWVFAIPEAGTWTVTATDKADITKTKSAEFEIVKEGQFESVELSYALVIIENGTPVQGYAWANPDAQAPVYKVLKPIIENIKQYKNLVYTIYVKDIAVPQAYFKIGLFSDLLHSTEAQVSTYDMNSGITNAGNAKEFTIPIASTVPDNCYIGVMAASLTGVVDALRLE
jgi:hypothetical protein